jgi:hypothetical protein
MPLGQVRVVDESEARRSLCPLTFNNDRDTGDRPDGERFGCVGARCMWWATMATLDEPSSGTVGACAIAIGALNIRPGGG